MSETPPTLRRATPADAPAIAALTDAAYRKYIARLGREPQPMRADYAQLVATHPVWVLEDAGQLAGVLVLMHEPDTLLIYSVAIAPGQQRRGLGRRLLAHAEDAARAAGYARIRLYTNALMSENVAMYGRMGYQETGREPFGEQVAVHFAKELAPADGE